MTPAEIHKLLSLAEQKKAQSISIYAVQARHCSDLEERLQDLSAPRAAGEQQVCPDFQVQARWQIWQDREKRRLEALLHTAALQRENMRGQAMKDAARIVALENLLQKAEHADLLANRRRAEQNEVPPDA